MLLGLAFAAVPATGVTRVGATPPQSVDLRVLVISADGSEPSAQAWTAALQREGVPFTSFTTNGAASFPADFLATGDHAHFQAVVLGFVNGSDTTCTDICRLNPQEGLSATDWNLLQGYEATFGIRQVDAYAYPGPAIGLNFPTSSGTQVGLVGQLTAAGHGVFPYLVGSVPVEDNDSFVYFASPSTFGADYPPVDPLVNAPDGSALLGVLDRGDGRQELVDTVASNATTIHGLLLAHGMLDWTTKGVHLGYQRNYLTVHADDVFLPDDAWDATTHTTNMDNPATAIRMTASDVNRLAQWESDNNFVIDLAFNGGGHADQLSNSGSDPLYDGFETGAGPSRFRWINHTYNHLDLNNATTATIVSQINQNVQFASGANLPIDPTELVTGDHSGLHNPNTPPAFQQTGIKWTAADTTVDPQQFSIGPALTVPRHPMNIYYNAGTRAQELDEYNWLYYYNCTYTTCLPGPVTWDQLITTERDIMIGHVIGNDPNPHFVHQSNLAQDGIIYDVLNAVLARYQGLYTVPFVQPTEAQAGGVIQQTDAFKAALAAGQIQATMSGAQIHITNTAPTDVAVPITGQGKLGTGGTGLFGSVYGGDRSGWLTVPAGASADLYQLQDSAVSVSADPSSAEAGQDVTLTATVTGSGPTPTGTVTFTDGPSSLGTASLDGGGSAQLIVSNLAVGDHTIGAVYHGDTVYDGSGAAPPADVSITPAPVPDPPTIGTATAGNGSGTVTFTAPANNGGHPITGYTASCASVNSGTPGSHSGAGSPLVVTGLTNGKTYRCSVTAQSVAGSSAPSAPSNNFVPATVPGAPTNVKAISGSTTTATGPLTVSFTAPVTNGGSAITSYRATCMSSNSGVTGAKTGAASPLVVTGLTTGKTYTCRVKATNTRGTSLASAPSLPVIVGSPAAPTNVNATSGSTTAATGPLSVGFTPGANNGVTITSFTATCTSSNSGVAGSTTGAGSPLVVNGLTTGKTYTCMVKATNARGAGLPSNPSLAVIVGSPAAPTGVTVVKVANGQLKVSFTAGANNGASITSFTATCRSSNGGVVGSKTGPASPITVTGLTTAKTYTCTVTATNARGPGLASTPSATIVA